LLKVPAKGRGAVAVAVLGAPLATLAVTPSPDAQIWSQADVVGGLTPGTTLTGTLIARAGEALPDPTLTALGLQLDQRLGALILSVGYRHEVDRHSTGGPDVTQLALLETTYVVRADRSTIELRARADNTLHTSGNPWRFRIRGEYRWATRGMDPLSYVFVNDEEFYQASEHEWSRNRAQAGIDLAISRRTDLQLYYQYQYERIGQPARINAMGLYLTAHLE
jgi:Protein of unknown function (DUF2490)